MLIVQDFSEKLRDQYLLWKLHVHCESHTPLCYYLVSAYFPSGHYTVEATPSSTSIIEMIPGSYIASFPGPRPASRHLQYGSFWSLHWGSFTLASFPGLPWLQFLIACSMQNGAILIQCAWPIHSGFHKLMLWRRVSKQSKTGATEGLGTRLIWSTTVWQPGKVIPGVSSN